MILSFLRGSLTVLGSDPQPCVEDTMFLRYCFAGCIPINCCLNLTTMIIPQLVNQTAPNCGHRMLMIGMEAYVLRGNNLGSIEFSQEDPRAMNLLKHNCDTAA